MLETFCSVGDVHSACIVLDKKTGFSLGFGIVKFSSESEAAKAMYTLSGKAIRQNPVTISKPSRFQNSLGTWQFSTSFDKEQSVKDETGPQQPQNDILVVRCPKCNEHLREYTPAPKPSWVCR